MERQVLVCFCLMTFASLTLTQKVCKNKNNQVAIVMDTSGTIEDSHLQEAKHLAMKIVDKLELSTDSASNKISLVTYASEVSKRIYCNQFTSGDQAKEAIKNLDRIDGELTNTQSGLEAGFEILDERGCDGQLRNYKHHTIVLISDGRANRGEDLKGPNATAAGIRSKNVKILAIGVGEVTYAELVGIAGSEDSVIYGYNELDEELNKILENKLNTHICQDDDPGLCKCTIDKDTLEVTDFTKTEVIRNFEGKCYTEKLEAAIVSISNRIKALTTQINNMKMCKKSLAQSISQGFTYDKWFNAYENCTLLLSCEIKEALWKMEQKSEFMKNELKLEKAGFGDLKVTGATEWLVNKMPNLLPW